MTQYSDTDSRLPIHQLITARNLLV